MSSHPEANILRNTEMNFSDLKVTVTRKSNRKIDNKLEENAQLEWKTIKANANKKGLNPWDGRYYRLENLDEIADGSNELIISDSIRYSQIRAFQKLKVSEKYSIDYHTLHISTIGFVETSDNYIIFGYRKNSLNNSSYTVIGGGLQPDEIEVKSADDLRLNILKEINEELGLNEDAIEKLILIGFVHAIERMNFYPVFHAKLTLTKQEVEDRFPQVAEHDKLIFVERGELEEFIKDKPDYMKAIVELL